MRRNRGKLRTPLLTMPAAYRPGVVWRLDKRSAAAREVIGAMASLWQDLGGFDGLSVQERVVCERLAFLRWRLVQHEEAVMDGKPGLLEPNEYAAAVNSMLGLVKTLGLKRRARDEGDLRAYLAATTTTEDSPDGNGSDSSD